MREFILQIVNARGAVRGVELALDVMGNVNPSRFDTEKYLIALGQLINEGEIIELDYIPPESPLNSIKSIYFKKGTQFPSGDLLANSSEGNMDRQGEGDSKVSCDEIERKPRMENSRYGSRTQMFYGQRE